MNYIHRIFAFIYTHVLRTIVSLGIYVTVFRKVVGLIFKIYEIFDVIFFNYVNSLLSEGMDSNLPERVIESCIFRSFIIP